jgi:hypothetical protein
MYLRIISESKPTVSTQPRPRQQFATPPKISILFQDGNRMMRFWHLQESHAPELPETGYTRQMMLLTSQMPAGMAIQLEVLRLTGPSPTSPLLSRREAFQSANTFPITLPAFQLTSPKRLITSWERNIQQSGKPL